MAINSKNKGNKGEREVASFMKEWTGYEFTRVPQSGGLRWKSRENIAGDIICSDPKHERHCKISIEVKFPKEVAFEHLLLPTVGKNTDKVNHYWAQATRDAKAVNKLPLLFIHRNGMKKGTFFVVMPTSFFEMTGLEKTVYGVMRYLNESQDITIINSEDLKKLYYKRLHREAIKLWCKFHK